MDFLKASKFLIDGKTKSISFEKIKKSTKQTALAVQTSFQRNRTVQREKISLIEEFQHIGAEEMMEFF